MSDLTELLEYIDPALCVYQDWVNVGMALKHEGYTAQDWERWSAKDAARYHAGECEQKWKTFQGSGNPVTAGTIVQMAKDGGWVPPVREDKALDWDSEISMKNDLVVVDKNRIEHSEIRIPERWNPSEQIITYLEALFDTDDYVGYVTESWENKGKWLPTKGSYDKKAGELIQEIRHYNGDLRYVFGDYNPDCGAWIRFNPLDGKGVKNKNVTDFKYALVESDTMDLAAQKAIIEELELPAAALVYSGGKSLHAIVRIEASSYEEYKKRVDYLYNVCGKNGLKIDAQNRNPSRLSRMPGVMRNGKKQYLLSVNTGKASWDEWREWIEGVNDDLPEPESMAQVWDNLPELAPPLIDGVLRQGHKMLIAGPSKAGKSYALIELCCAIAEGQKWLEWQCTKGRVMYVNLELDRASCLHRFKDVYTALEWKPENLSNIDIWNLRGGSEPMDKLAPKLIRRARRKNYIAIVIDPIYKVITGDENSADQMAHFCNQFDKVCTELGCAVIYCHHHSKGYQGGKRSMDRASGSGVFARDPDALLDLTELELDEDIIKQQQNMAACDVCQKWLDLFDHRDDYSPDDALSKPTMLKYAQNWLLNEHYEQIVSEVGEAEKAILSHTAWRIEGTLREYPKFNPVNAWFKYPVHEIDSTGVLGDIEIDDGFNSKKSPYKKNFNKKKSNEERAEERKKSIEIAYEACKTNGQVTVKDMADYMEISEKTVKRHLKEHGGFWIDESEIGRKK